jgi:hypothetical protein
MNRGQLKLRVIQAVALNATVDGEEETLVEDLLNEGVLDILSRTRLSMKCLDITLDADSDLYDVPDEVLHMDGLYDQQGDRWIRKVPELVDSEGEFAMVGHDLLKIPSSSASRTLSAYYVARPLPMTTDAHDPSEEPYGGIPVQFHPAIVNYACWQAGSIMEQEGTGGGEKYRQYYEGKEGNGGNLKQIRMYTNRRILPTGRRRPPVDGYLADSYL